MELVKFVRGPLSIYNPGTVHKDSIFFCSDDNSVYINGVRYGVGSGSSYKGPISGLPAMPNKSWGASTPGAHRGDIYDVDNSGYINGIYVYKGNLIICNSEFSPESTKENYQVVSQNWDIIRISAEKRILEILDRLKEQEDLQSEDDWEEFLGDDPQLT